MRTIVHLSDLHFGRVDEALIRPLITYVERIAPDVVVVSGDLTQRARTDQFKAARRFLDELPQPQIVVPGNHDISLHNVFSRFVRPLAKYRRYISSDLQPRFIDSEIAVLGVNTARSLTIKDGRISTEQIAQLREMLAPLARELVKIIVTHHPFDLPTAFRDDDVVGRAPRALEMLSACQADILLAGHFHRSHAQTRSDRHDGAHEAADFKALVVQAGTATSTRGRGEQNSFNVIRVEAAQIEIERVSWQVADSRFEIAGREHFERTRAGWLRREAPRPAS